MEIRWWPLRRSAAERNVDAVAAELGRQPGPEQDAEHAGGDPAAVRFTGTRAGPASRTHPMRVL